MLRRAIAVLAVSWLTSLPSFAQQPGSQPDPNLRSCLAGYKYSCKFDRLSPSQQHEVAAAWRQQNYRSCLAGYKFSCDLSLLDPQQQVEVSRAWDQQNYRSCLSGYKFSCEVSRLSDQQREVVARAWDAQNYRSCLAGFKFSCDLSRLTAEQRAQMETRASAAAAAGAPSLLIPSTPTSDAPACAENGSCYGDMSEGTGRPKTVLVHGYYRKDGTYVRGHYRSRPRR